MDIKVYRVGRLDLLAWRIAVARPMTCKQWQQYLKSFNVRAKIAASKQRGTMPDVHRAAADAIEWINPKAALSLRRAARLASPTPDSQPPRRTHQSAPNTRTTP